MIIQLRGTSGSGKTTAMRKFMQDIPRGLFQWEPVYISGRRKPQFYHLGDHVAILGHYESICGGVDTFKNYKQFQLAVRRAGTFCEHVLMEGLMLSDDVQQTLCLFNSIEFSPRPENQFRVIYITTDLLTCIDRVKSRRAAKGKGPEFNEKKLRDRHAQIERTRPRLEAAGIYCRRATDEQAVRLLLEWVK